MNGKRYGTSYGGYVLPFPLALKDEAVIYSFGAGEDISFDVEIARETGATVHIFDFTPRAIEHVNKIKDFYDDKTTLTPNKRYGGGDSTYLTRIVCNKIPSSSLQLHPYGLAKKDGELQFYYPINPEYVSLSSNPSGKSTTTLKAQVKSLESCMKELNHDRIDVLKLDIEGLELEVLDSMLKSKIRPKYLCIDFDSGRAEIGKEKECLEMCSRLRQEGYVLLNFYMWDASFYYSK